MSKSRSSSNPPTGNRYGLLLEAIFRSHHAAGVTEFVFERTELETAACSSLKLYRATISGVASGILMRWWFWLGSTRIGFR